MVNGGYIYNCALSGNFGNAGLNYLGGIASINIRTSQETKNYTDKNKTYTAGTIEDCRTEQGRTVTGKDCVGGIVSWNLTDGLVKNCASAANVTAAGNCAGGIAGRNSGLIESRVCRIRFDPPFRLRPVFSSKMDSLAWLRYAQSALFSPLRGKMLTHFILPESLIL